MCLFSYKITRDFGFAPNPFHGVCTLATCKPHIRKAAEVGDLIVGCGSAKNKLTGRLLYAMRVSGKCTFQEYWEDERFASKRPNFKSSRALAYGDNIYHGDGNGGWIQERSHHTLEDGSLNESNLCQDTGADAVLWSDHFVYWGGNAPEIPGMLRDFNGEDLYPKVRDFRRHFTSDFVDAVNEWFETLPEYGRIGRPSAWR